MNFDLGCAYTRIAELKDVENIYQYRNDKDVYKSLGGFSHGMSREDVKKWILSHNSADVDYVWVIADKETDECVGHFGLYNIDFRVGKLEIGIAISKTYWGKGIGKKCYSSGLKYAFGELRMNRVETYNLASNYKIIKLKESLGFKTEGVLKDFQFRNNMYEDIMVMAILKREYCDE